MNFSNNNHFNILIVDDEYANIYFLSAILKENGFNVSEAKGGVQALEIANKETPDLILLDIMMPDMNGFEVLSELQRIEKLQHIPVIMLTALSKEDNFEEALKRGATDFITKPLNENQLIAKLQAVLKKKEQHIKIQNKIEELKASLYASFNFVREQFESLHKFVEEKRNQNTEFSFSETNYFHQSSNNILRSSIAYINHFEHIKEESKNYKLDAFFKNLTIIYQTVFQKKKLNLSIASEENFSIEAESFFTPALINYCLDAFLMIIPQDDIVQIETHHYENNDMISLYNKGNKVNIEELQLALNTETPNHLSFKVATELRHYISIIRFLCKKLNYEFKIHPTFEKAATFQIIIPK